MEFWLVRNSILARRRWNSGWVNIGFLAGRGPNSGWEKKGILAAKIFNSGYMGIWNPGWEIMKFWLGKDEILAGKKWYSG